MNTTNVFKKNLLAYNAGIRRIVNHGGQGSSKNYSILQLALLIVSKHPNVIFSVMSETMPHLKLGAILDFETILKTEGLYNERNINYSAHQYFFGDSIIEFLSADTPGKVTGPRRDFLYVNECINIPFKVVDEAARRTRQTIFYDYNPNHQFWIQDKVFTLPDAERAIIRSNHLDNEYLSDGERRDIILRASLDENFKRVHIDLEFGISEGLIFPTFNLVDSMPVTDRKAYGLDFGFSNDPTAYINVRINNGELWLNELLYQTGLTNPEIARFIKGEETEREENIGDSAEPKSIEELRRMGIRITGADKGTDSVRAGIDWMKSFKRTNITKRSVNLIKEFRNYKWKVDNNGEPMNVPVDLWNHGIDCVRYCRQIFQQPKSKPKVSYV